jgi:hypothetical protein
MSEGHYYKNGHQQRFVTAMRSSFRTTADNPHLSAVVLQSLVMVEYQQRF